MNNSIFWAWHDIRPQQDVTLVIREEDGSSREIEFTVQD